MLFPLSPRVEDLKQRVTAFMEEHVYPAEDVFERQLEELPSRWQVPPVMEELKAKAKAQGLWNLFLPKREYAAALSNLEYAPLCEIMGRVADRSPEVVQLLGARHRQHGDARALRHRRSRRSSGSSRCSTARSARAFAMTEPAVASSDATNIAVAHRAATATTTSSTAASGGPPAPATRAARSSSSWARPTPTRRSHQQQSMILVPCETPGVTVMRHAHRVRLRRRAARPRRGRCSRTCACRSTTSCSARAAASRSRRAASGPGRIHHCMRLIGLAERALELMCKRALSRASPSASRSPSRA